jgi:hypothetical protein
MSEQSTTRSVSDILASDGEEQGQDGKLRTDLPATLCAELDAFMHFRTQPLNQMRASVAVVDRTSRNDRDNVLRFLEWLVAEKRLPVPTLAIFHSKKVAALSSPSAGHWIRWVGGRDRLRPHRPRTRARPRTDRGWA